MTATPLRSFTSGQKKGVELTKRSQAVLYHNQSLVAQQVTCDQLAYRPCDQNVDKCKHHDEHHSSEVKRINHNQIFENDFKAHQINRHKLLGALPRGMSPPGMFEIRLSEMQFPANIPGPKLLDLQLGRSFNALNKTAQKIQYFNISNNIYQSVVLSVPKQIPTRKGGITWI